MWQALGSTQPETKPYSQRKLLFVICYLRIAICLFPLILPHCLTLCQAHHLATQSFLLIGIFVQPPIILLYSACSYWNFFGAWNAVIWGYY